MCFGRVEGQDLFIISDLHLGGAYGETEGARGFRLNTHAAELTAFLLEVRDRATTTGRRAELVINGDFVDFLAESGAGGGDWRAFVADQDEAVARLDAIQARDAQVFDALASLLESNVAVTLLLGNHDLELSLPAVRSRLCEHLRVTRSSPFCFLFDGEALTVGDTLIEHGNRYDGYNVVDFDRLRRFRSEASRRLPTSPDAFFEPPAGSRLVAEVMNPIKVDYGFIDLLKPETEAALPLLIALEPSYATDIAVIERISQLRDDATRRSPVAPARPRQAGNIGARSTDAGGEPESLHDVLARRVGKRSADRLLALADEATQSSRRQQQQIGSGAVCRALSFIRMAYFTGDWEDRVDLLLDAFQQIQSATLLDWSTESEVSYREAAEELALGGFRHVVFGHTHAPKVVDLPDGARYLNTGSWADRLRLPDALYSEDRERARHVLREFATAMKHGRLQPYVEFVPTFALIRHDDAGRAQLGNVHVYTAGLVRTL
jgi:UDP-2,3-diacylglucosamine pyrophosphatase LpxH